MFGALCVTLTFRFCVMYASCMFHGSMLMFSPLCSKDFFCVPCVGTSRSQYSQDPSINATLRFLQLKCCLYNLGRPSGMPSGCGTLSAADASLAPSMLLLISKNKYGAPQFRWKVCPPSFWRNLCAKNQFCAGFEV